MNNEINSIINEIIIRELGKERVIDAIEHWGGGAHNTCYKVCIGNPPQTIFIKIEKDGIFPRTRRCQIEREVYGNKLIASSGVPCPGVIGFSFEKMPVRYVIQEFIDEKLAGELIEEYTDLEKSQVENNIRGVADVLLGIKSDFFGEVFTGGEVGRHATWKGMMSRISGLLQEDAAVLGIFTDDEMKLISDVHAAAQQHICYRGQASLVHGDLHEFNVFIDHSAKTSIKAVFDFGFSLFMAPYVSYFGPRAFDGKENDLCDKYGVSLEELTAFDLIFSLECVVFLTGIRFAPEEPYGYMARKKEYIDKCKRYLKCY